MSITINWDTLTQGPDGEALAEAVRSFIDDKFQKVTLPPMIRSVKVHSFDFGSVPPQIDLRDVCDPLPDFYEGEEDDDDDDDDDDEDRGDGAVDATGHGNNNDHDSIPTPRETHPASNAQRQLNSHDEPTPNARPQLQSRLLSRREQLGNTMLSRAPTPGLLGGTSNLGYFHLPLSAGLSGTTTPLAAVAGAQFHSTRADFGQGSSRGEAFDEPDHSMTHHHHHHHHHRSTSFGSPMSSSATTPTSRPTSRHKQERFEDGDGDDEDNDNVRGLLSSPPADGGHGSRASSIQQERSAEDVQIVFHVSYSGNVKLSLTAEILLDYPMPSFVGIPLQLNITGLTFDGVGILAYMKKKAHFCFVCPEDAEALVGGAHGQEQTPPQHQQNQQNQQRTGALLEEIKVESEIGQREGGKQVLKNVGKVEKFVLEQVRRIFDDEFVYPSFWTFLV